MKAGSTPVGTIRAVGLQRLVERLDRADPRVQRLLAQNETAPPQLSDPYAVVPLAQYVALLEDIAEAIDEPMLGAEMGQRFRPADIGPVGLLFAMSSSLDRAFAKLARYLPAFQTSTSSGLIGAGDEVLWAYKIHDPRIWPRRQDAEYAVAATCELIRSCLTTPWWPIEVHFEHAAPIDPAPIKRLFGAPVQYNQPANGLLLARSDLERINRNEDGDLLGILERHINDLLDVSRSADSFSNRVNTIIGIYLGHQPIDLVSISAALDIPPRTLQRRLAEEGTSLRSLVRRHRIDIASSRLDNRDMATARLAESLGYSDSSAFSRAYRNWTGRSPIRNSGR